MVFARFDFAGIESVCSVEKIIATVISATFSKAHKEHLAERNICLEIALLIKFVE